MQHEGGCLCGAVRYAVTAAPQFSAICHCQTCRRAAAAASVAWLTFETAAFRWLRGEPRSFRSSPDVVRTFCEHCGTPLTYAHARSPLTLDVTTLSMDEPASFPPTREVWLAHRIAWTPANAALTGFPHGGA
ncbi:MAG TPA: GFA family protein [Steroidobacteraceae bacterium]|nr:GFA family protein [Steroidobacteraceae bacterium]